MIGQKWFIFDRVTKAIVRDIEVSTVVIIPKNGRKTRYLYTW